MPATPFVINRKQPLYLVCHWFVIVLVAVSSVAQADKQRGPRALAILELGGAEAGAQAAKTAKPIARGVGFPRLVPVAVLENGEYHDATIYKATPVPLAVQSGIVYEAQHAGVPQGLFTINEPTQLHGSWVAVGKWQLGIPEPAAKPEAKAPVGVEDDGPPRLRRSTAPPKPPPPENKPKPVPPKTPPAPPAPAPHTMPAISDAAPYETRAYTYSWSPEWKRQYTRQMLDLAQGELAAYSKCRPSKARPCTMKLEQIDLRAFDLDTNNDAEIVLTAQTKSTVGGQPQTLYLTLIGYVDWQAHVQKTMAAFVDDAHLDTTGRLEFIDAVDADGDGHGELLFRRVHGRTQSFELYRVRREQAWKLFDGAESSL